MKLVVFGLTISSSWANGHATIWRSLCRALAARGHSVSFFERDVPYYAAHRDTTQPAGCNLVLYDDDVFMQRRARVELGDADVAIITSYCPDAFLAAELAHAAPRPLRVFYDLDTPVTLARLERGEAVSYIGPRGFADFDLVLSYTGGAALELLQTRLGARRVAPLYGSVDAAAHHPVPAATDLRARASCLGTYAEDRQAALEALFLEPARRAPEMAFLLGGSSYPRDVRWPRNVRRLWHVPPPRHSEFYCSSDLTVSVTRAAMARLGWCPSGRLFEAAACGTPVMSDWFPGLDAFFTPGEQILVARSTDEALDILELPAHELRRVGLAARERALTEHTAGARVRTLENALEV